MAFTVHSQEMLRSWMHDVIPWFLAVLIFNIWSDLTMLSLMEMFLVLLMTLIYSLLNSFKKCSRRVALIPSLHQISLTIKIQIGFMKGSRNITKWKLHFSIFLVNLNIHRKCVILNINVTNSHIFEPKWNRIQIIIKLEI